MEKFVADNVLANKYVGKATGLLYITLVFAVIFCVFTNENDWLIIQEKLGDRLTFFDYWFYIVQIVSTLGYSDIIPYTRKAKILTSVMLFMAIVHVIA